ncbi:MAG: HdeD family acid-resistance protein [Mycobacterium sp.]|nr:HdeD family acid-resistance protein [Mycobacterium sp.]
MTTPTTVNRPSLFQHLWKSTVVSGVLAIVLGALVLWWPGKTLLVSAFLFGAYLLVSGIAQVVFAFGLHTSAGSRILLFISGAASLILAILAFRHFGTDPTLALWLLAIWIAVGFIFRGVATTATAISELHGTPGRGWSIFFGIITIIAGVVVLSSPFESLVTLTLVVGIWLIVIGVFEIISGLQLRHTGHEVRKSVDEVLGKR